MILLTGATGSAGSFIAKEFVRERERVRILPNFRTARSVIGDLPAITLPWFFRPVPAATIAHLHCQLSGKSKSQQKKAIGNRRCSLHPFDR